MKRAIRLIGIRGVSRRVSSFKVGLERQAITAKTGLTTESE